MSSFASARIELESHTPSAGKALELAEQFVPGHWRRKSHMERAQQAPKGHARTVRAGELEQIAFSDDREHVVVVDHPVVEDRIISGRLSGVQPAQDGELADVFLMRHLALRVQPLDDRAKARLDHLGLKDGASRRTDIRVSRPKYVLKRHDPAQSYSS